MEEVIEHFGESLLCLLSGAVLLRFFAACLKEGGILCELVRNFMESICG